MHCWGLWGVGIVVEWVEEYVCMYVGQELRFEVEVLLCWLAELQKVKINFCGEEARVFWVSAGWTQGKAEESTPFWFWC